MSRKSNGRSADNNSDAIALTAMLRPPVLPPVVVPPLVNNDERFYSPVRLPVPVGPGGRAARLRVRPSGPFRWARVSFESPSRVDICRKRKERRQVMFATGRTGKGSRAQFRKRSHFTGVSCK